MPLPCPAPDVCYMILVRHGATANNLLTPPRIQGSGSDLELSEEGRRQAKRTAEFLADAQIAAAFSSPLRRAAETAELIARPHGLDVIAVESLRECDAGEWEGKTWEEIEREEPEARRRFFEDPATFGYRGGENLTQLEQRVRPALEELLAENVGGNILVVAHNVVNRVFLGGLLGVPPAKRRGIPQDNCGVNVLRYRNGAAKLAALNSAFHL